MASSNAKALSERRLSDLLKREFRGIGLYLFLISGFINILALTGAFYMLQIYDRALTSGSVPTLVALSALAIGLYLFQGLFDVIRSQVLVRIGARLDRKFAPIAHKVAIDMPRFGFSTAESLERGRDVDTIRGFLGSQAPMAIFDLPWVPVFLVFVYLLHPMLGALTLGGAVVLTLLTVLNELLSRKLSNATQQAIVNRNTVADSNARHADILKAMGFARRAISRYDTANREHLKLQTRTSDISGTLGAVSRVLRMLLQSALLGLGAYLTIMGDLSAGAIIACSVAATRALAPIDLAITNWKSVVAARGSMRRLRETVIALDEARERIELPTPSRSLTVDKITVAAPTSGRVLLTEVSLELTAGQALGVIGPSAGGKTTLAKSLVGIWSPIRGSVRLDGAEINQWQEEVLGAQVGYLPQEVGLLDATIWENISRFADQRDGKKIVAAAMAAGVHDMIVHLEEGYDTPVGAHTGVLSAGQRQRIGLARALYGDPFLVVMDEPNSNLDADGEVALTRAIEGIKQRGGIAVIIAHRPSALVAVDYVAVIQNGRMTNFGTKDDVLPQVRPANRARPGALQELTA
ncbi:MAG: type I secretion system permease/ATPase [Hyphomicrobiales bacterium]|nr:MAG: type I secretion system permease/ATPase [Hyphomicrobiales bacterium]